jgi:hypothetical protein
MVDKESSKEIYKLGGMVSGVTAYKWVKVCLITACLFVIVYVNHIDIYLPRYLEKRFLPFGNVRWEMATKAQKNIDILSKNEPTLKEIWDKIPKNIVTEATLAGTLLQMHHEAYDYSTLATFYQTACKYKPNKDEKRKYEENIYKLKYSLIHAFKIKTNTITLFKTYNDVNKTIQIVDELSGHDTELKKIWMEAKKENYFNQNINTYNVVILNKAFLTQDGYNWYMQKDCLLSQQMYQSNLEDLKKLLIKSFSK